jgi:hypothetical protein
MDSEDERVTDFGRFAANGPLTLTAESAGATLPK